MIQQQWINQWAECALRIHHLNTLIQHAIDAGKFERAHALANRVGHAAYSMYNELVIAGAIDCSGCPPEYPFVYWHRGLAYESLGNKEEAYKMFAMLREKIIECRQSTADKELLLIIENKLKQYGLPTPEPLGSPI